MTTIHLNEEQVQDLIQKFDQGLQEIDFACDSLERQQLRIIASWQSTSVIKFLADYRQALRALRTGLDELDQMQYRLRAEVLEWMDADAKINLNSKGMAIRWGGPKALFKKPHDKPPSNMRELAHMVDKLYEPNDDGSFSPIRVVQIGPNEYLVLIAGTIGGRGANNWNSAVTSGLGRPSDYSAQLKKILMNLPPGAQVHMAGHSQGGIVANNIAGDPDFKDGRLKIKSVTTFGSPVSAKPVDGVAYKRYAAIGDPVPLMTNEAIDVLATHPANAIRFGREALEFAGAIASQEFIPGKINPVDAHGSYGSSEYLEGQGTPFEVGEWDESAHYQAEVATGSLPIVDAGENEFVN